MAQLPKKRDFHMYGQDWTESRYEPNRNIIPLEESLYDEQIGHQVEENKFTRKGNKTGGNLHADEDRLMSEWLLNGGSPQQGNNSG